MEGGNQEYYSPEQNTRLRDLEERNHLLKERVILLGKNLIETKEELEEKISLITKQNNLLINQMEIMEKNVNSILEEVSKAVKRDEMLLIERMLKDFQPLNFVRKEDIEGKIKK
jgi:hypothetical protein